METKSKKRIESLDVCRGLCILLVILGHQFEKCGLQQPLQFIQTFHMPLIFIISGYFISDSGSIKSFVKKKSHRLLLPYATDCLIAMLLSLLIMALNKSSLGTLFYEGRRWIWISAYANGSGHGSMIGTVGESTEIGMLWFLTALFWSSIIVKYITDKYSLVVSCFLVAVISSIGIGTTTVFGWVPFTIQAGMGVVIWVFLGYYIKKKHTISSLISMFRPPVLILAGVVWLISSLYGGTRLYKNNFDLGIVDIIGAVAGSWIVFYACYHIANGDSLVKRVLSWVGVNSILIYSLHFIEHNIIPINKELIKMGIDDPTIISIGSWCIIVLAACLLTMLLKRFSFVRKIYYQ